MGAGSSAAKYSDGTTQVQPGRKEVAPVSHVVTVKPRTNQESDESDDGPEFVRVKTVPVQRKSSSPQVGGVFAAAFDEAQAQRVNSQPAQAEGPPSNRSPSPVLVSGRTTRSNSSVHLGAANRGQTSWQQASPQTTAGGGGTAPSTSGGGGAVSSSKPAGTSTSSSNRAAAKSPEPGASGNLHAGQKVWLEKLQSATELNGQEALILRWDLASSRWVVRLQSTGEDKRIRAVNLSTDPPAVAPGAAGEGDKELEQALLQSNWAAIYQLFYERFGLEVLGRLERGYAVKAAVEMTLSIVSKCFALLRSDPHGRLHCTPLHIAALQSSTEAAEVIVRDVPQVIEQTHKPSNSALCPLHIAILCGSQAIVELLLDAKASPNVRTIHDICPLHLAATTSKELCQLLLTYNAEPNNRDVMGSTCLHYAASFKQHDALDVILTGAPVVGQRWATDGDQKRVTPLHVCCALYASSQDLAAAMFLLSVGAKPWQADVSGASARDVVPWVADSALMQFFEGCGDNAKAAAQEWLEDFFNRGDQQPAADLWEAEAEHPEEDKGTPQGSSKGYDIEKREFRATMAETMHSKVNKDPDAATAKELKRLKEELEQTKKRCAELEPLAKQLQYSEEKVAVLEQTSRNQQQVFQDQKELLESIRGQYQAQIQELKERQESERQVWEERSQAQLEAHIKEARKEELRKAEDQQRDAELRIAEFQAQLQQAEHAAQQAAHRANLRVSELQAQLQQVEHAAQQASHRAEQRVTEMQAQLQQAEQAGQQAAENAMLEQLEKEEERQQKEQQEQMQEQAERNKERFEELQKEIGRLSQLCSEERHAAEVEAKKSQDFKSAARTLCAKYGIQWDEEAASSDPLSSIDQEIARLHSESTGREDESKAVQQELLQLKEEVDSLRRLKLEAEDRCQQLRFEVQQVENNVNAKALRLEAQLRDAELQHSQALDQVRSEVETCQQRAEAAEAKAAEMQPTVDKYMSQLEYLEAQFAEEQAIRKKYHNQIQDMKGNIRVYCRFRPLVAREVKMGDDIVLRKVDAFSLDVHRPAPHNDFKSFQFDSVFGAQSSQDEIFEDCKDLVQSAVDGYNVTIFAYGQTGAGKTHTMYGSPADPGLAPRSIYTLFDVIDREQKKGKLFKLKAYMVEVYKQDIIDLLTDPSQREKKSLQVKKDPGRGVMYVEGVSERHISTPEELEATLLEGERRRHIGSTKMNSTSSRSHLLLSIIIECNAKDTEQVIYGKITLCDLAGSERPKKSEVSGDALKEAIEINKSLTSLGDVIEALTKGSKSIPYRNHKLTMLMQDSLGGSAKTLMFVNCSPGSSNFEETMMSLKWASRARQVTNDVKRNADSKEVARLKQVIAMMSQAQKAQEDNGHDDGAGMVS